MFNSEASVLTKPGNPRVQFGGLAVYKGLQAGKAGSWWKLRHGSLEDLDRGTLGNGKTDSRPALRLPATHGIHGGYQPPHSIQTSEDIELGGELKKRREMQNSARPQK